MINMLTSVRQFGLLLILPAVLSSTYKGKVVLKLSLFGTLNSATIILALQFIIPIYLNNAML